MAEIYQKIKAKNNKTFIARSCRGEDSEALQNFFQQGATESAHTLV